MSCHIPLDILWMLRNIMHMRNHLSHIGGWAVVMANVRFQMSKAYQTFFIQRDTVEWRGLICGNVASPRSKFIVWMMADHKLPTMDRLFKQGMISGKICKLCNQQEETHDHLFLSYNWTVSLKKFVLDRFELPQASELKTHYCQMGLICRGKKKECCSGYFSSLVRTL